MKAGDVEKLYNYFRTYDPTIGRYTQSDPIGLQGGLNIYAYAYDAPVNLTDPYGLRPASHGDCGGAPGCQMNNSPTRQFHGAGIQGCALGNCYSNMFGDRETQHDFSTEAIGGGLFFCWEPPGYKEPECDLDGDGLSDELDEDGYIDELGLGLRTLGVSYKQDGVICVNIGLGLGSPISASEGTGILRGIGDR